MMPDIEIVTEELAGSTWEDLICLGEEIGREWRASQTSAELLAEMRR